eukprot:TRINITY_DN30927_c0_g1_i1.p1 TRINITY_DN30927_c0_g1~~TRINITY_DN30927_c0_g1_i1.p1  ORF type:complete len:154 (-),score=19.28 TRINITY_DN30927_c0_g1_i1:49-510(-)
MGNKSINSVSTIVQISFAFFLLKGCLANQNLGNNSQLEETQICQVTSKTVLDEGYNIADKRRCSQFCTMSIGCAYWTYYKHHKPLPEEGLGVQDRSNVCYALDQCKPTTKKCLSCASGQRVKQNQISLDEARRQAANIIRKEKIRRALKHEDL